MYSIGPYEQHQLPMVFQLRIVSIGQTELDMECASVFLLLVGTYVPHPTSVSAPYDLYSGLASDEQTLALCQSSSSCLDCKCVICWRTFGAGLVLVCLLSFQHVSRHLMLQVWIVDVLPGVVLQCFLLNNCHALSRIHIRLMLS